MRVIERVWKAERKCMRGGERKMKRREMQGERTSVEEKETD